MLKPMRAEVDVGGLITLNDSGTVKSFGWEKSKNVYLCGLPGGGLGPMYGAPVEVFAELRVRMRLEDRVKFASNQWSRVVPPLRGTSRSMANTI
jgi:hypothetical protein